MKILYLGHPFFGYYKYIIETLTNDFNVEVDYYNLSPNVYFIYRAIKFNDFTKKKFLDYFFSKIVQKTTNKKYDIVLVIGVFDYHLPLIEKIKAEHGNAKYVLYQWDALKTNKYRDLIPFFDKVFSFDRGDCERHKELFYLPLFYIKDYDLQPNNTPEIDLLFVGSADPERYEIIKKIEKDARQKKKKFVYYMYIPKLMYLRKKLFDKSYKKIRFEHVNFKKISHSVIAELMYKSRAILDIERFGQSGLTMRTFETLGAGRKLITTNQNVRHEKFYNPQVIQIISRENPNVDWNLIANSEKLNNENIIHYSINYWLKKILEIM